jgi:hypothetical protein
MNQCSGRRGPTKPARRPPAERRRATEIRPGWTPTRARWSSTIGGAAPGALVASCSLPRRATPPPPVHCLVELLRRLLFTASSSFGRSGRRRPQSAIPARWRRPSPAWWSRPLPERWSRPSLKHLALGPGGAGAGGGGPRWRPAWEQCRRELLSAVSSGHGR